jgi:hypothetical protein
MFKLRFGRSARLEPNRVVLQGKLKEHQIDFEELLSVRTSSSDQEVVLVTTRNFKKESLEFVEKNGLEFAQALRQLLYPALLRLPKDLLRKIFGLLDSPAFFSAWRSCFYLNQLLAKAAHDRKGEFVCWWKFKGQILELYWDKSSAQIPDRKQATYFRLAGAKKSQTFKVDLPSRVLKLPLVKFKDFLNLEPKSVIRVHLQGEVFDLAESLYPLKMPDFGNYFDEFTVKTSETIEEGNGGIRVEIIPPENQNLPPEFCVRVNHAITHFENVTAGTELVVSANPASAKHDLKVYLMLNRHLWSLVQHKPPWAVVRVEKDEDFLKDATFSIQSPCYVGEPMKVSYRLPKSYISGAAEQIELRLGIIVIHRCKLQRLEQVEGEMWLPGIENGEGGERIKAVWTQNYSGLNVLMEMEGNLLVLPRRDEKDKKKGKKEKKKLFSGKKTETNSFSLF